MQRLPLDDVQVVDLTVARAGPTCVRQLADWGADVIRVDRPPSAGPGGADGPRHGSDFQHSHRNKRSVTIDLTHAEGGAILRRLVQHADVLVENMRPAVKHRLGFDYEAVHSLNPRLVYGSVSGFGQDGPYADRGGVDQIAQGMAGIMSVTGLPGQGPVRAGIAVTDVAAGLYLAVGILAALHERDRSGEGQWVQTSLLEAGIGLLDFQAARWTIDGEVPGQAGNDHPTMVPMGCFRTADGLVNISASMGRLWEGFCHAIGRPDLLGDPRFDTSERRLANNADLTAIIAECLATQRTAEVIERCSAAGVPAGPVYGVDEVFADPQVRHLGMVQQVHHPVLGPLDIVRTPVSMSRSSNAIRSASPDPGQHTDEVLGELGFDAAATADLHQQGVV